MSKKYKNNKTKIRWSCALGHEWKSTFIHIKNGHWCPECAGNVKDCIENCQDHAKSKNGKCLSTEYKNCKERLDWECEFGHQWKASFDAIKNQNQWCPQCAIQKSQKELTKILQDCFPNQQVISNYRGFEWFKNKRNLEIDIWIPSLKLAIEYDGKQHFKSIRHFGGYKQFQKQQKLDKLKNSLISQHPGEIKYFVRFNYLESLSTNYVKNKLLNAFLFGGNIGE